VTARSVAYEAASTTIVTTTGVQIGTAASDTQSGTADNDTMFGLSGNDTVQAGDGNDVIYGNQDLDSLMGGDGNDSIYGGQNAGPAGSDGVQRQGIDSIDGGAGNDLIYGNHGDDLLSGGAGRDLIYGGQDDDSIYGGSDNDTLIGGMGSDSMFGGSGADRFVFSTAGQSPSMATADTIDDFTVVNQDRIDVSGIDANDAAAGDQAFSWLGASLVGGANAAWYNVQEGDTFVFASTNGDANPELAIRLTGLVPLTLAEFVL
jgi:Ca2+-binding RTX toxin-like protein